MGGRLRSFSYKGRSLVREVFIETGTFQGESLGYAHKAGFKTLYSVEFYKTNADGVRRVFRDEPNVTILVGTSPDLLPAIIDWERPTTFWLDGHYQGGPQSESDSKYGQCPVLHELKEIFMKPWATPPVVLIDDAHMFTMPPAPPFDSKQWPTIDDIKRNVPNGYGFEIEDNVIYCTKDLHSQ